MARMKTVWSSFIVAQVCRSNHTFLYTGIYLFCIQCLHDMYFRHSVLIFHSGSVQFDTHGLIKVWLILASLICTPRWHFLGLMHESIWGSLIKSFSNCINTIFSICMLQIKFRKSFFENPHMLLTRKVRFGSSPSSTACDWKLQQVFSNSFRACTAYCKIGSSL